ncbi:vomeronasal type-2 receptor 26-like [Dendropsophus ebraccatus]|uniref:vomeronasal type-2 receptor 26-like n=1 Tax=Dendropsophus ebraccatus TaxID=150705 RepID=UPI0038311C0B
MVWIFASSDHAGEQELHLLSQELTKSGLCIELAILVKQNTILDPYIPKNSKAEIVIVCGTNDAVTKTFISKADSTLRHYMKLACVTFGNKDTACFNEKGEIPEPLAVRNKYNRVNDSNVYGVTIGLFDEAQQLHMIPSNMNWLNNMSQGSGDIFKTGAENAGLNNAGTHHFPHPGLKKDVCLKQAFPGVPQSRCSKTCSPGYRKAVIEGYHICCYDCILCSDGEFSNISDTENCQNCYDDEWPNDARDKCVPKETEFLSYETDVVAYVFLLLSLLSSIVIVLIIGIFLYFWKSPVVRANNRNLSFIILISLQLSLLCIFFYIGKPEDTTCMFRHISFGIIFTAVLSSILAKTIMVCIAFKATSPGSSWRKWMGVRLPNAIVLIFSSLQVLNAVIWLSLSPPFQELDMDSYPGKIIIQCNEGSVLAFYLMLGYMGFLAAVSFVLAFLVRTLPDIYNEAKYITFSMLVFCSVWICAIPAYLSSKGKSMVSVEVFAILASGNGIVGCIFFPKLWIVLKEKELKTKNIFVRKKVIEEN